jgi:hypothetical protein
MRRPEDIRIHGNADLYELWCELMGPWGFAQRSVWLIFLTHDGGLHPVIVPIDDVPPRPDDETLAGLGAITAEVAAAGPVDSVAALLSRPGSSRMTAGDRAWARGLAPLTPRWPVHLATAGQVRVFSADDLIAA